MAICRSQGLDSLGVGCSQVVRECGVISRCLLRKCHGYFLELHTKSTDIGSVTPVLVLFLLFRKVFEIVQLRQI